MQPKLALLASLTLLLIGCASTPKCKPACAAPAVCQWEWEECSVGIGGCSHSERSVCVDPILKALTRCAPCKSDEACREVDGRPAACVPYQPKEKTE